jgi:cell wall-associated NlpC family hydrolase
MAPSVTPYSTDLGASLQPTDLITPDSFLKNLPAGGAGQNAINIDPWVLSIDDSLILLDTPFVSHKVQELTLGTGNSTTLPDTSTVDPLTGQTLSDGTESHLSFSPTVSQALQSAHGYLKALATDPNLSAKMNLAFGNNWNAEVANNLVQDFAKGQFSALPAIEILPSAAINEAKGAFAAVTNTIYLSREFVTQNASNSQEIVSVLLEEIGHYIDSRINTSDALGDEGERFSALVRGASLNLATFWEDDSATISLGNREVEIEQASYNRDAAVSYARQYALNYQNNSSYGTFYPGTDLGGGDCANFVSKCLKAGGLLNQPIPGVVNLVDTLEKGGLATRVYSINDLKPGDVITYDIRTNGTPYDHTAIYLGNGKVASHTTDRLDVGWTLGQPESLIRFFRINDASGGGGTREFQNFTGYVDSNPDTRSNGGLNIRSGPGSGYAVIGKLSINSSVNFVEIERSGTNHYDYLSKQYNDDWYRIAGTTNQWVSGAYITTPLEISQRGRYG